MEFKLSDIEMLSSATRAFVDNDENLKQLLGDKHPFYSLEAALEGKKNFSPEKRLVLARVLRKQYETVWGNEANDKLVRQHINHLEHSNTFTVTTGQQLHLFLGPAFVLYKILATVKAAEQYKKLYPQYNFVPIYWLASEDHDFEEIKDTRVFQHKFEWITEQAGATGRFHLKDTAKVFEEIRQKVSLSPENIKLLDELQDIYGHSSNLSEATIKVAHYLFGKFGLVCIDGDDKALKTLFAPNTSREILEQQNIVKFNDFSGRLEKNKFSLQLKGRDINIFYLSPGKRSRIIEKDGHYQVMDSDLVFSKDELLADIERNPENYSPNAVLRPVYQECILPNICYIGGNAEVNYWLQLKNVFENNGISAPLLALRPSIWVIPSKTSDWLEAHGISPLALFNVEKTKALLDLLDKPDESLMQKASEFSGLRQELQDIAAKGQSSHLKELVELGKQYEKLLKKIDGDVSGKRLLRAENELKKLEIIKQTYYDLHHIQERNTSALEMLIRYGSAETHLYNSLEFNTSRGEIINL